MKKYFLLFFTAFYALAVNAQARGIKIAYIDMEYILEKVPDYAEAKNQLELKAQKWKQEIEAKKTDITKLKDGLKSEKALLTKELIEEREEEIRFLETELLSYQEKRFGPKGDLISQKSVLIKPIQDQVFTVVQDVAEIKKYDFVFDKSSDLTMLFAAQRHDISDLVVRRLSRSSKREQLSGKEIKKLEEEEAKEDLADDPDNAERQQKIEDKKAQREKLLADRKAAQEEKRRAYEERRDQLKQERDAKRSGTTAPAARTAQPSSATTTPASNQSDVNSGDDEDAPATTTTNRPATNAAANQRTQQPVQGNNATEVKTTANDVPEQGNAQSVDRQNAAQQAQEDRARTQQERKKAIEDRKKKILEDREAAKRAREGQKSTNTTTPKEENKNDN